MAEILEFRARNAPRNTIQAPCDIEDNGIRQVHRGNARGALLTLLETINTKIDGLRQGGNATASYEKHLADEQPHIDEFHRYCPPTTNPYSGQMSQSMSALSVAQFESKNELMERLTKLLELLARVEKVVAEIGAVQQQVERVRHIVKPRQLRLPDWEDGDPTAWEAIDYAADPETYLTMSVDLLAKARLAVEAGNFGEAQTMIGEAAKVPGYLYAVGNAVVAGGLVEIVEEKTA